MKSYKARQRTKQRKKDKRTDQRVRQRRIRVTETARKMMNITWYLTPVQTVVEVCKHVGYTCHVDSQSDIDEVLELFTGLKIHD